MRGPLSLRARLWLAGAAGVVLAALLAGWLLGAAFERSGQRALDQRLDDDFATLAGLVEADGAGGWRMRREPADERYARVFSGWYWRIGEGEAQIRSRSLWDEEIALPDLPASGPAMWTHAEGPRGQWLRVRIQQLRLPGVDAAVPVLVAGDRAGVAAETREFRMLAMLAFAGIAAVLLAILAWQVEWGLRPLRRMRRTLQRVRNGDEVRFGSRGWPGEVAPLATQIDELLDEHARRVQRARHAAQDLAHELKTPLSVLSAESQRPGERTAAVVAEQVARMRGAVERRLSGALAVDTRERTPVAPVATELCRMFAGMASVGGGRGAAHSIEPEVQDGIVFAGAREDLEEMLGNLVDNAVKWARSRVRIHAAVAGGRVRIVVEDDGPGMGGEALARAVERGTRLDTRVPGHGLGLSIVADLASGYDGRLMLENLAPGLRATLDLPAGDAAARA